MDLTCFSLSIFYTICDKLVNTVIVMDKETLLLDDDELFEPQRDDLDFNIHDKFIESVAEGKLRILIN